MRGKSEKPVRRAGPFSSSVSLLLAALSLLVAACSGSQDVPRAPPSAESDGADQSAEKAARRFLDAFSARRYDNVWEMLAPEARQRWPDEPSFGAFLDRKFGAAEVAYEIERIEGSGAGSTSIIVSLTVKGSGYKGPPLLLAQSGDSWAVADAGPVGSQGPIIGAPQALRPELTVPILVYHHFALELPDDFEQRTLTVTSAAFEGQLAWLQANGYQSITMAELFNAFYYDLPLPAKPIIPIFDDGYEDAYVHAFPLLKRYNLGATVAVITGAVDKPGYLSWKEIREMAAAGLDFVSHTVSHANLAAVSEDAARSELADSKRTLQEGLGRPLQFFVYPYGQPFAGGSPAAQQTILRLLQEEGYVGAATTSSGPPYITTQRADSPYQLHRIPVSGGESLTRFAASIGAAP